MVPKGTQIAAYPVLSISTPEPISPTNTDSTAPVPEKRKRKQTISKVNGKGKEKGKGKRKKKTTDDNDENCSPLISIEMYFYLYWHIAQMNGSSPERRHHSDSSSKFAHCRWYQREHKLQHIQSSPSIHVYAHEEETPIDGEQPGPSGINPLSTPEPISPTNTDSTAPVPEKRKRTQTIISKVNGKGNVSLLNLKFLS
jgi:hypothetical protein